jgi:hypothetical protein
MIDRRMQEFDPLTLARLDAIERPLAIERLINEVLRQFAQTCWRKAPPASAIEHGAIEIGRDNRQARTWNGPCDLLIPDNLHGKGFFAWRTSGGPDMSRAPFAGNPRGNVGEHALAQDLEHVLAAEEARDDDVTAFIESAPFCRINFQPSAVAAKL